MTLCIQNYSAVKKSADNPILTIRLNEPENARFWRLMEIAKARNAYAGKSDILRELLGLNSPSVLTKDEIHFFRTGEKKGDFAGVKNITPNGIKFAGTAKGEQKSKRKVK